MMDVNELLESRREEILKISKHYGAYNVRIFGSVARGESESNSDIDILVDMEPGRSLFDLGGLLYDVKQLLGVEVDVVTEKGLRSRIRDHVLDEAVPL
jgi:predicted nucleotidyltransferase